jgi:hypothetical protein
LVIIDSFLRFYKSVVFCAGYPGTPTPHPGQVVVEQEPGYAHPYLPGNQPGHAFSIFSTLMKKEIKFSSYIRKFRVEQLQSLI